MGPVLKKEKKGSNTDQPSTTNHSPHESRLQETYPEKVRPEEEIFGHIHRGDTIFIGTGCGEPQYLVHALTNYVQSHPKAFFDAEVFHVWTLGVAPY
ncbi:MAG: hypothetical protein HXS53_09585, partial [Theionarchaea archaeon]|nr:hypothetical protein [Theionarchaea archaeon]